MRPFRIRHRQRGAAAVELAMIAIVFVTLLMAIIEFGRWMYTLEMVADATRAGARTAVVCDINDATIKGAVQARVPQLSLSNAQVSLQYFPAGCVKANCQGVQISITGATFTPAIPFLMAAFPIPPFSTSLPRESLESVNAAGEVNPVCV
jgi:Flp pilus assembly protein TadG